MKKFNIATAALFLGVVGASAETPGELTQILRDDIEKRIVEELSKSGHTADHDTAVLAALYLTIVDLNKGIPGMAAAMQKMLSKKITTNFEKTHG